MLQLNSGSQVMQRHEQSGVRWILQAFLVALSWSAMTLQASAQPAKDDAPPAVQVKNKRMLGIVLYPKFELLDVYGPAEIFGNVGGKLKVVMIAEKAGPVASTQGPQVMASTTVRRSI
jgi:hypothetical protein